MKERIEAVREKLAKQDVDALIVTYLPHVKYLVGFSGSNGLLLVKKQEVLFFTDFRYKEQSKEELPKDVEIVITGDLLKDAVSKVGKDEKVAFDSDHTSYSAYSKMKELLGREPQPLRDFIYEIRMNKEEDEIVKIKNSQRIVDEVFGEIIKMEDIGKMKENELAALIEYEMRRRGAERASFPSIVASGPHSALPHAKPRNIQIGDNTMLILDFGAVYSGYASDMTRTLWLGKSPDSKFKEIYGVVLDALKIAEEKAKPGMLGKEIDALARDYIKEKGYGDYFGHGLGHGVGLEVHEKPGINPKSEDRVLPGMVFTIEPGIYIPGFGGVRIEDLVVMREDGVEILTNSPKDLIAV